MRSSKRCLHTRRGVIAPLAAIFMVLMISMVAFAIDVGYMTLVRTELQCAADAAASAGAAALLTSPSDAKTAAQTFGNSNKAAGTTVSVATAQDVVLGNWNIQTLTFTPSADATAELTADSVKVTCRVAASRGNAAKFFFAPIFGKTTFDQQAVAIAQIRRKRCSRIVGLNYVNIQGGFTDSFDSRNGTYASQTHKQE